MRPSPPLVCSVSLLLLWGGIVPTVIAVSSASAGRVTSRAIERVTVTRNALEAIDRRTGVVRERSEPLSIAGRRRQERLQAVIPDVNSSRSAALVDRQKYFRSPVLDLRDQPSAISTTPVTTDAEVAYRSGIKYFLGSDGVRKDDSFAYMWLNFALAQGHPLARSALQRVIRYLAPGHLAEAQERTTLLAQRFLDLGAKERAVIRDRERQRDLESLLAALEQYRTGSPQGVFPVSIRETAREVCRTFSSTCGDLLNLIWLVPDYMLRIPVDPLAELTGNHTGYYAVLGAQGQLILFAPSSEVFFAVAASEPSDAPLDQGALKSTIPLDADEARGFNRPLSSCLRTSGTGGTLPFTVYFFLDCVPWEPATVRWDFGDGSTVRNTRAPVHTFTATGSYAVTITAEGLHGRYAQHRMEIEVTK